MSKQAKIVRGMLSLGTFIRSENTIENLDKKRRKFTKIGRWMKPEKGSIVSRQRIADVDVDVILNHKAPERVIVYAHGGGFVFGGNQVHLHMLSMLSRLAKATVYAVDYKTSPEHKFPVARDEVISVYKELLKNTKQEIFMAGDSSGGNLILVSLIELRDEKVKLPQKVVLISPPTDATFTNEWIQKNKDIDPIISKDKLEFFLDAYTGSVERKKPKISPYYAELSNLPPMLFHVGSDEIMFGDSKLTHEKIVAIGGTSELYIGEGLWHLWHLHTKYVPESRDAVEHIAKFILA
jgi:acetyl esterase/lipase